MCVFLWVCAGAGVHVFIGQRSKLGVRLNYSPPSYLRQGLSLNLTPDLYVGPGDVNLGLRARVADSLLTELPL